MNSRVRRKKISFLFDDDGDAAELHFKIEPEVHCTTIEGLSLYFII